MADAYRDSNFVPTLIASSNADGFTPVRLYADPVTHRLLVDLAGSGTGDVVGPASSTDNAVVRFDGTTGKLIQNSVVIVADTTGNMSGSQAITVGVQGTATGSFLIKGTTSGTVTLKTADAAGTWSLTLPIDDGTANQFLQTDGNGVTTWASGGSGTVTAVSVASANGFAGSSSGGATPALTLTTTVTGVLKGNGTAISAATAGSDYAVGSIGLAGGQTIAGSTLTTENLTLRANAADTTTGSVSITTSTASTTTSTGALLVAGGVGVIGRVSAGTFNGLTITANGTNTLNISAGKSLIVTQILTLSGTDSTTMTFPTTSATIARTDAGNTFTGVSTASAWVLTSPTITTKISPTSDDGAPLGDTTHNFSDLFLASGAVINYANGNVVLTQSSGILTMGTGELRITSANVGTNADSVPTLSSTSTLTNKTLTAPTLGGATSLADGAIIKMIVPTVDGTATGPTTAAFVSGYTSSAVGDLVILDSNGKWQKTDANTASIYNGMLGVALAVAATDAALLVALSGSIVYATAFPTMTIGAAMYMSETAGAITATAPTTTDAATRIVGYAVHADKIYFNPSNDWITHT